MAGSYRASAEAESCSGSVASGEQMEQASVLQRGRGQAPATAASASAAARKMHGGRDGKDCR